MSDSESFLPTGNNSIIELRGVVDAMGICAGGLATEADEDRWTVFIPLSGWRPARGVFRKSRLEVRKNISDDELTSLWSAARPYQVICITARISEMSKSGSAQANLVEFLGLDDYDAELNAHAREL